MTNQGIFDGRTFNVLDVYLNGDTRLLVERADANYGVCVADGDGNVLSVVIPEGEREAVLAALPALIPLAAAEAKKWADAFSRTSDEYALDTLPGGLNWFRGRVATQHRGYNVDGSWNCGREVGLR